jgi:hypothetical protein
MKIYEFTLSNEEVSLLRRLGSKDEVLASLLNSAEAERNDKVRLRLDTTAAEKMRASLTELLARTGFGEDYSPTKQGLVLEELIDRFFIS